MAVGRSGRRGCVIEVYGDGSGAARAERSLDELVQHWRAAGRPSLADCEVTVTYAPTPSPTGAIVVEHDGCFTALRWPS